MRNLLKYALAACIILAMPMAAHAQKIGVVNSQDVVQNSEAGKRAFTELQGKAEAKQKELNRQTDEIRKMEDNFRKQGVTLSNEAKSKMQAELDTKVKKIMDDQNSFAQLMEQERKRLMDPLVKVLDQVLADYAKKNGYTVILDRVVVMYSVPGSDITADISKEFESASKRAK